MNPKISEQVEAIEDHIDAGNIAQAKEVLGWLEARAIKLQSELSALKAEQLNPVAIKDAPQDGTPILLFGFHDKPQSRKDLNGNDVICDCWYALAQWDIWRDPHQWVFTKDGSPITWGNPVKAFSLPSPQETTQEGEE